MHIGAKAKPAAEPRPLAKLALIRPDGSEGGMHMLREADTVIGRGTGSLFDHDSYLSPAHARIIIDAGRIFLEDVGSLNGIFIKITAEEQLKGGDIFRIGQELLRFDPILEPQLLEDGTEIMGSPNPGYWGRLSVIMGPSVDGSAFPLMGEEMVLGRERGDILFSDDGYVSGTHAKLGVREDGYLLTDLGSSNGSFIRITEPRQIPSGTFILMGQQLFRIELL
jgi:pSer/pThr/pTyr-binding forkhead associated (FHA) protein